MLYKEPYEDWWKKNIECQLRECFSVPNKGNNHGSVISDRMGLDDNLEIYTIPEQFLAVCDPISFSIASPLSHHVDVVRQSCSATKLQCYASHGGSLRCPTGAPADVYGVPIVWCRTNA